MRYKPDFCNSCGEKIEHLTPAFTDSSHFCNTCKNDFLFVRFAPIVFMALMGLFGIFGIGSLLRSSEKTPNIAAKQLVQNPSNQTKANNSTPLNNTNTNVLPTTQTRNIQSNAPNATKPVNKQTENVPASNEEAVYFCGALTKKGTPCSRRVKGGGRCWQHKGQTAALPQEKLLVSQ